MVKPRLFLLLAVALAALLGCSDNRSRDIFASERKLPSNVPRSSVEAKIYTVAADKVLGLPVVLLSDKDEERFLPITIGTCESEAILRETHKKKMIRPMTHDLLKSVLRTLGVEVLYIYVDDLRNNTYYATISLKTNDSTLEVDARPSDAIALAVRVSAPIYVARRIMDENGINQDMIEKEGKESPKRKERHLKEFF